MLGNPGRKLSTVVELAEELYDRVVELRETAEATRDRVAALEEEVAAQGAVLDALAEREGIDVEAVRDGASTGDEPSSDDGARASDTPGADDDGR